MGDGAAPARPQRDVPPTLDLAAALAWRVLVVAGAVWVTILVVGRLRLVAIPLAFALFVSALLEPMSAWLKARRVPPALAAVVVLGGAAGVVVGILTVAGLRLAGETRRVAESVTEGWDRLLVWVAEVFPISQEQVRSAVDDLMGTAGEDLGPVVFGGASTAAHALIMVALTVVITFFLLKDGDHIASWLGERIAARRRDRTREVAAATWTRVSSFARGQALIGVVEAALTALALVLIGVPAVLPLALLALIGSFIPLIGPIVAGGAAALVALSAAGFAEAVWVIAAAVAINQVEGNLLQPFVLGRAVRLHPLVVLLAVVIGGVVGGLAGAFVAVPLTAAAVTAAEHLADGESRRAVRRPGRAA